jgi:hypothetical protein
MTETMVTSDQIKELEGKVAALGSRLGELENTVMLLLRDHKQHGYLAEPKEKAEL